jgi:outer membrane protein assembly factor BamA
VAVEASRVINNEGSTYYWLGNDIRVFWPLDGMHVLALMSNLSYQFGKFPEYIRFGLGGSGTLRGFSSGEFRGAHRWIQTMEWRISPFPKWFFGVPFVGRVDVQVGTVFFMDTGIVWRHQKDFSFERFHGGGGCGLRIYSPAQDVVRLDFGFNAQGDVHLYFSTGIRF